MGNALFIVWRESLEAILVISILYAWIGARGDGRIGVRYLWVGVGGGLLLGAGLLVADVERLINLEWLPPLLEPVWDSSAPLDDGGTLGGIASTFAGYRSQPIADGAVRVGRLLVAGCRVRPPAAAPRGMSAARRSVAPGRRPGGQVAGARRGR